GALPTSIRHGAGLMRASFAVVRTYPRLLWFPVLSAVCLAVTTLFWIAQGSWLYQARGHTLLFVPFVLAGVYALTFVGIFFSVALAGAAVEAVDGGVPSLSDGFDVATMHLGSIAAWAAYSMSVNLVLSMLQSKGLKWLGNAAKVAWSLATIFVVPLIAFEDLDAGSARRRSFELARENWRAETGGLGALRLALLVPGLVCFLGYRVVKDGFVHSPAGKVVLGVLMLVAFAAIVAGGVVRQVFAVELYREAVPVASGSSA